MDCSQTEAEEYLSWWLIPVKETELLSDIPHFAQFYVLFLWSMENHLWLEPATIFVLASQCRRQSTQHYVAPGYQQLIPQKLIHQKERFQSYVWQQYPIYNLTPFPRMVQGCIVQSLLWLFFLFFK